MELMEPVPAHGHDASRIPLGHHRAPGHAASARGMPRHRWLSGLASEQPPGHLRLRV